MEQKSCKVGHHLRQRLMGTAAVFKPLQQRESSIDTRHLSQLSQR
jgi:hypothetical protein